MRKQYHLRPGNEGYDAWDVDRLIRLSRTLPVQELDISTLPDVDTAYWFDHERDPPTVRNVVDHMRLAQAVDMSHPIILGHDGRVMDGMHRIVRALLEGRESIDAVRFPGPIQPDYRDCDPSQLPYD